MAWNVLRALRNLISEAQQILHTTKLPEARSERACELLTAAVSLADDLLIQSPAAPLGKKGGKQTAKRGPDYFRKIAGMRKELFCWTGPRSARVISIWRSMNRFHPHPSTCEGFLPAGGCKKLQWSLSRSTRVLR